MTTTELDSLVNQPQLTSTTSLVSQNYQRKSTCGKACYRVKRALFARDGVFLIGLILTILAVSTVDWALWKISLNRFHAKDSNTTYSFFVLQLYSGMMLFLSFTAMMLSIHVLKTIDDKQRTFPQSKFVKMSLFDAVTSLCSSMSSASVAGHLQTLLSQGALPLVMVASILILGTKYTPYQVFGAACILTGTLIAAIPGVNAKDMSGRSTKLWAIILYVCSLVPLAIGNTYREYIFKDSAPKEEDDTKKLSSGTISRDNDRSSGNHLVDRYNDNNGSRSPGLTASSGDASTSDDNVNESTPLGRAKYGTAQNDDSYNVDNYDANKEEPLPQLNIFYLMFWTSLYQFCFSLCAFPILTLNVFGGVAWKDMPLQFSNGARCFAGYHVPELECEIGLQPGVILTVYVLFNFGLCIMRLLLIKHGSALLLQITNALALLFSNIVFSWKFIMGQYTEQYNKYDFLGLIGVLCGFVIFQVGVYYKDLEAQRAKLLKKALEQEAEIANRPTISTSGHSLLNNRQRRSDDDDNDDDNYKGKGFPRTQSSLNTLQEDVVVIIDERDLPQSQRKTPKTKKSVRYSDDVTGGDESDENKPLNFE